MPLINNPYRIYYTAKKEFTIMNNGIDNFGESGI